MAEYDDEQALYGPEEELHNPNATVRLRGWIEL